MITEETTKQEAGAPAGTPQAAPRSAAAVSDRPTPQTKRRRGRPRWLKPVAALVITLCVVYLGMSVWKARARASAQQTLYKVTAASNGEVKKTVSATGTLQPWSVVDIKSKAGGRVDQLSVEVGDEVKKGQIIARIDPSDTQLTVRTAQADLDAARAREQQSSTQYQLQISQSSTEILNAQSALDAARASLAAAQARLKTAQDQATAQPALTKTAIAGAQANYDSAVQSRVQLDATQAQDKAAAKAAFDQAKANEKNAQADLTRQKALLEKGFVAASVVDASQATYDVARAATATASAKLQTIGDEQKAVRDATDAKVAQAKAQLAQAKAQSVDVTSKNNAVSEAKANAAQLQEQVEQAQAALAQAKADVANNRIKNLDVTAAQATIARSQATLQNAQQTLDQTTVRAPSEGVVLQKYVEQGTIITSGQSLNAAGTSIIQLGDTTKMYASVSVDETDIASIDEGQDVEVTVDAYPGVPFEGKVARIDPLAVVTNNVTTFNVRVELDNSTPTFRLLKPGMNVTCEFVMDDHKDVLTVPNEAVHEDDGGYYVTVAHGGTKAGGDDPDALKGVKTERRVVEIGLEGDEGTEIKSGLKPGEQVVTQTIEPEPAQKPASSAGGSPFGGGGAGGGRGFGGGGGGGGRGR